MLLRYKALYSPCSLSKVYTFISLSRVFRGTFSSPPSWWLGTQPALNEPRVVDPWVVLGEVALDPLAARGEGACDPDACHGGLGVLVYCWRVGVGPLGGTGELNAHGVPTFFRG